MGKHKMEAIPITMNRSQSYVSVFVKAQEKILLKKKIWK